MLIVFLMAYQINFQSRPVMTPLIDRSDAQSRNNDCDYETKTLRQRLTSVDSGKYINHDDDEIVFLRRIFFLPLTKYFCKKSLGWNSRLRA